MAPQSLERAKQDWLRVEACIKWGLHRWGVVTMLFFVGYLWPDLFQWWPFATLAAAIIVWQFWKFGKDHEPIDPPA